MSQMSLAECVKVAVISPHGPLEPFAPVEGIVVSDQDVYPGAWAYWHFGLRPGTRVWEENNQRWVGSREPRVGDRVLCTSLEARLIDDPRSTEEWLARQDRLIAELDRLLDTVDPR